MYEIAVIRKGASPQRSTAKGGEELREAVFALIRAEGGTILESDHAGLAAFVAHARAAVDKDGFVAVEFGSLAFTIRTRDAAEPTKDSAAEPVAAPSADGCRVLRADQLTRGMTVRLKDPADLGPVDYNRWFTIVELVPGRRRTVAPLSAPLTPGDLIAPMAVLPDIENPHEAGVHDADDAGQKRPAAGVFGGAFVGKVPVFVGEVPVR